MGREVNNKKNKIIYYSNLSIKVEDCLYSSPPAMTPLLVLDSTKKGCGQYLWEPELGILNSSSPLSLLTEYLVSTVTVLLNRAF